MSGVHYSVVILVCDMVILHYSIKILSLAGRGGGRGQTRHILLQSQVLSQVNIRVSTRYKTNQLSLITRTTLSRQTSDESLELLKTQTALILFIRKVVLS